MFENIIGHTQHLHRLELLVKQDNIPTGICFVGQPLSGRCSCALELSRGMMCIADRTWKCTCTECLYMRLLEHENLLMLGSRNFLSEIYCAQAMIQKYGDLQTYMFFYRAVIKLARRADALLWDGLSVWKNGIRSSVAQLLEILVPCRDVA